MKKKKKVIIGICIIVGVIILAISLVLCFYPYFMKPLGGYREYSQYYDDFDTFKQEYDRYYERYIKDIGSEDEHIDLKNYEFENVLSCTYKIWGVCGCDKVHQTKNENCKTLRYVEAYINIQIDEENSISIHYLFSKQKPEEYSLYDFDDYEKNNGEWENKMYPYGYVIADENYKSPVLAFIYNESLLGKERYEKEEELQKLAEEWNPIILEEVNKKIE